MRVQDGSEVEEKKMKNMAQIKVRLSQACLIF